MTKNASFNPLLLPCSPSSAYSSLPASTVSKANHTPPLLSLSPWLDSALCAHGLEGLREVVLLLLASSDSAFLSLSQGWSLISLHSSSGFQLFHHQPRQGRRLPEDLRGRPLLYPHPLMWPASRFLSVKPSVKFTLWHARTHTHTHTHTHSDWHSLRVSEMQIITPFSPI